jgi:hypothetical protein
MAKFRNDTGSVLRSQEFGVIPPGEFEAEGYDPEVHGVIPGCVWLDAPAPDAEEGDAEGADGESGTEGGADTDTSKPPRKRGKAGQDKENAE